MKCLRLAALLSALIGFGQLTGCAGTGLGSSADTAASVLPVAPNDSDARRRARIRLELAANYYQQRNFSSALEELREALGADPTYADAFGMLGLLYMDLDDRPKADQSFQRALQIAPKDAEINNNYGWYLCQTGREREAIAYFDRALEDRLYATPARPLHNAGVCLRRLGELPRALAYLERSFQLDPRNAVAMFHLAEINLDRRELDRAQFYAQRLLSVYDPTAQTLWLALRVQHARGDRDGEASLASQLRRRFPVSNETRLLNEGRFGG